MDIAIAALVAVLGYLIGSVSFARLAVAVSGVQKKLEDLRTEHAGTGESSPVLGIGANSASMILGGRIGLLISILDMLKASLPMLALGRVLPDQPYDLVVAVAVLIGHNWPVYYRFQGGRGFAVMVGTFLVLDWLGLIVCVVLSLVIGMLVFRSIPVSYAIWPVLMVPWVWLRSGDLRSVAFVIAMNLLFVLAVLPEISLVRRHRKLGTYDQYMSGLLQSSPRWRGMQRMARFLGVRTGGSEDSD